MYFLSTYAIKGGHHAQDISGNSALVTRGMFSKERALRQVGITLINASLGPAIANEVLCRCRQTGALNALDQLVGIIFNQIGVIAIAFVASTPPVILGLSHSRAKNPVNTSSGDAGRGSLANFPNQFSAPRCTKANIVGVKRCTTHIIVPVNRVRAPDYRYASRSTRGVQRCLSQGLRIGSPIGYRGCPVAARVRPSAIENAADSELPDVF